MFHFSNIRGFDFFFPLMFIFYPTLKRIIWGNQRGFKKTSSDVIFLKFQCFDNISKRGGCWVKIDGK